MSQQRSPAILAQRINEGVGEGFSWGSPLALFAFIILLWI
jgi:hypothetical protein